MPNPATATTAAASPLLIALAVTGLCALVALLSTGARERAGFRARPRRLSSSRERATAGTHGPAARAPRSHDLPPPDEAAGLPVTAPKGASLAAPRPSQAELPLLLARARAPGPPGPRLAAETFAPVAQRVDHTRRLAYAESRVGEVLATLPPERWFIERFVLIAGSRIPFVALGECGVFALWAVSRRPQWGDIPYVDELAGYLKQYLPDYPGPVNAGLCGVLEPDLQPRYWCPQPESVGAWVMGIDSLVPWMTYFGSEHGLGIEDVARFRALAGPNWSRPVKPVAPGIPNLDFSVPRHG